MPLTVDWTDLEARSRALLDQARVLLEGPTSTYEGGSARSAPDSHLSSRALGIMVGTSHVTVLSDLRRPADQGL
jgi:hypothetical protein